MPTNLVEIAENTCLAYLIRHGATNNNLSDPPRLQGNSLDSELSPKGRWQAERTGQLFSNLTLHAVYSSPLLRARQTAEQIAQPHALPIRIESDLAEVDVGNWEGNSWPDIEQDYPEAYRLFMEDPGNHGYVGGENLSQVQARATATIQKIVDAHLGERIAIVAHNVVNRTFLAQLLGLSLAEARAVTQDNCGVNVIRFKNDNLKLCTTNSVFHPIE